MGGNSYGRTRVDDRRSKNGREGEEWMKRLANNIRKKSDKCEETITNREPSTLSVLNLIKCHPLKNNSFTLQPGSHLANTHILSQYPNKSAPTPVY